MKESNRITENQAKSANFLRIIAVLKELREQQKITEKEYYRAKTFYRTLTGADIAVADGSTDQFLHGPDHIQRDIAYLVPADIALHGGLDRDWRLEFLAVFRERASLHM